MSTAAALHAARLLVWRDSRVAVVRNVTADREWWSLPGGGVEQGEAAIRETKEDLGLDVRLLGVARPVRARQSGRARVSVYFHAELAGGAEGPTGDPVGVVREIRWVTPSEASVLLGAALPDPGARGEYRVTPARA